MWKVINQRTSIQGKDKTMLSEDGFNDGGEYYTDEEIEIINSMQPCPICEEDNVPMGKLGNLTWYRCQSCGMEYNLRGQ